MKKNPLVSIIIPYFRKKKYFKDTINSIISQSYKKLEIIVIYDDANKSELQFVEKTLEKFKNKKILINKKSLGPGLSRNKGIIKSKGAYIAFCDADDVWKKNKLKVQLSFMQKNKIDFSHTNYFIINKYSKIIGQFKIEKKLNYQDLLRSCDIGLSTVLAKKKIFNKNKFSSLTTKEDYLLWLKILKKKKFISGINKNLSSWRLLEKSLSSSVTQKVSDSFKLYHNYEKYNVIISLFFMLRLTYFALIKKINIYLMEG